MENLIDYIGKELPNFVGFAVLAYVLWKLNNRLLDAVLTRLDVLESKVQTLIADAVKRE